MKPGRQTGVAARGEQARRKKEPDLRKITTGPLGETLPPPPKAPEPPKRTVKVKAHTRRIKQKPGFLPPGRSPEVEKIEAAPVVSRRQRHEAEFRYKTKHPSAPRAMGVPIAGPLAANAVTEATQIAKGLPGFGIKLGEAAGYDFVHGPLSPFFGDKPSRLQHDIGSPMLAYYKDRYGQGLGHALHELGQRPVSGVLDVVGTGGLVARGASIGARLGEAGSVSQAVRESYYPKTPRLLEHQGHVAQLAQSRHPLVRWAERLYDQHGENLIGAPSKASRVAKASAINIRRESGRRSAQTSNLAADIHRMTFHTLENRALRVRAYWEHQLPPELRNGRGLILLRNDLRYAHEHATGRTQRQLTRRLRGLDQALRAKPTTAYREALTAMDTLATQREAFLKEVFGNQFKDLAGTFKTRKNLMAQITGGEGGGYMPHTGKQIKRGASGSPEPRAPTEGVYGKPSTTGTNLTHQNELKRYASGELLTDPGLIVQAWLKAHSLKVQHDIKQTMMQLGEPIGPEGPKPGYYVVNPEGRPLPKSWKAAEENDDLLATALEEYAKNWLLDGKTAAIRGVHPGMVQVAPEIVHKFYSRFGGPRAAFGASPASQAADIVNGLVRTSLLYLNPAYIPANFAGNLAFGVLHQGGSVVPNLIRAGKIASGDRDLHRLIQGEVGHSGPTVSLAAETTTGARKVRLLKAAERKIANVVGGVADNIPREAAWLYEARKAGAKTRAELYALLTDPGKRALLNDVTHRAEEAMVNFARMAPWERDLLSKFTFVLPWIRGATAWGGHYPKHYPERAALIAPQAEQAQTDADKVLGPLPNFLAGAFPESVKGGIARVIPTQSLSPSSTLNASLEAAAGLVTGHPSRGNELFSYANPLLSGGIAVAKGQDQYGRNVGYRGALKAFGESISPVERLTKELLVGPKKTGLYRDKSRLDALLRRTVRGYPINIDLATAHKLAEQGGGLSAAKKDYQHRLTALARDARFLIAQGADPAEISRDMPAFRQDARWILNLHESLASARKHKGSPLTWHEEIEILRPHAEAASHRYPDNAESISEALNAKPKTEFEAHKLFGILYRLSTPKLSAFESVVPSALEQQAITSGR